MPELRRATLLVVAALVAGCAIQPPAASQDPETTPRPRPTPTPLASVDPGEGAASPAETATPSAQPTPDPTLIELKVYSCPGGTVLEWTPSTNTDFHHYTALRSPEREIARNWPPVAPAVDWGRTYATDRFVTDAVDASILPSDTLWHYRVMAYNARGRAIAASLVQTGQIRPHADLGRLTAEPGADGVVSISWRPYAGVEHCFSEYRILAGSHGRPLTTLVVVSDQSVGTLDTRALEAGVTYELRVDAVRTSTLGSFVLGDTDPLTFTPP